MSRSILVVLVSAAVLVAGCDSDDSQSNPSTDRDAAVDSGGADVAEQDVAEQDVSTDDTGTDAGADTDPDADPDASEDPALLDISALEYVGAFRVPAGEFGESNMNFAQGPIAYDARDHSVYLVGHSHHQAIAQFSVPELVDSTTVTDLNMAEDPTQPFARVLGRVDNPQGIDSIGGLKLFEGASGVEMLVQAYEYYDAPGDNTHTTLVVRDPSDLAGSAVDGYFEFAGRAHTTGWMSPIPAEWQDALGGTHITGNSSGQPIISRLSVGPTAFVFDPFDVVGEDVSEGAVDTTALLDFSLGNPLSDDLSNDSGENDIWTHLTRASYGIIAPGTRTYITLGHSGGHASGVCYKCTQEGKDQPCSGYCAHQPDDYGTYYWLWDVEDLVAVKEGSMQPHEVRPYAYGEFEVPFSTKSIGGGSYDPASNRLYLTAQRADQDQGQYSNPPVIMVYEIN